MKTKESILWNLREDNSTGIVPTEVIYEAMGEYAKEMSIGFEAWIVGSDYTNVLYRGNEVRWCTLEVANFGSATESDYLTLEQLYNIFLQNLDK